GVADELADLQRSRAQLRQAEADMASVLEELGLSRLGDIPGLTVVGAAAILAETGDPRRYDSSSSLVKHAGLAPADNASGGFSGQAHISRRGRPALLLAGGMSDDVGRRPVLLAALGALMASTVLFMLASSAAWLFLARGLQGLAAGAGLSAASAALLDLHPRRDPAGVGLTNAAAAAG